MCCFFFFVCEALLSFRHNERKQQHKQALSCESDKPKLALLRYLIAYRVRTCTPTHTRAHNSHPNTCIFIACSTQKWLGPEEGRGDYQTKVHPHLTLLKSFDIRQSEFILSWKLSYGSRILVQRLTLKLEKCNHLIFAWFLHDRVINTFIWFKINVR